MAKRTWILWLVIALGCVVISLMGWWVWAFANHPLNTSMANLATLVATHPAGSTTPLSGSAALSVQATEAENPTPLPSPENIIETTPMPLLLTPTVVADKKPWCGGPPLMFIQVAGIDEFNLADAIRIVRVDFFKPEVSVLAIQRATWVNIPYLQDHGITSMIINASHSYGVHFLGKYGGVYLLSETIALNFGIKTDHYLDINFDSFTKAVDAVGGVDIYLPDGAYDSETKLSLAPGWHHLDGKTALLFVRMRYSDSDWQRINRQTQFVMSLFKKLSDPAMLPSLPGLVNQVKGDFMTDLSPVEISQLVCLASNIPSQNVKFYEIGPDMVIPTTLNDASRSQIMLPKYDLIRPYIEQFINGTLP